MKIWINKQIQTAVMMEGTKHETRKLMNIRFYDYEMVIIFYVMIKKIYLTPNISQPLKHKSPVCVPDWLTHLGVFIME